MRAILTILVALALFGCATQEDLIKGEGPLLFDPAMQDFCMRYPTSKICVGLLLEETSKK